MLGICPCEKCNCDSKGIIVDDTGECETCQQIEKNVVVRTPKKKKTTENAVKQKKKTTQKR